MKTLVFLDELTQKTTSYQLPSKWNELAPDQLLFLVALVNKNISAEEIKLKMFLFCLNGRIKRMNNNQTYRIKIKKNVYDLSSEEVFTICEVFDYLFTQDMQRINPFILVNPFPEIRVGFIKLYGPADGLTDMIYETFVKLQLTLGEIETNGEALDNFISILYRKKKGSTSKLVRFIPNDKKVALLWFFSSCMNFMMEKFPLVFSGDGSGSYDPTDGQMRVIDALAKNDPTKKELVRKTLLYDNLYSMQLSAEEYNKIIEK